MNNKSFTLKFTGNATNKGSMRNDIDVSFESMNETFKLATDEGAFHGGNGTAPPPLVPMAYEMPDIIVDHVTTNSGRSIIGAKGAGEAGTGGAPAVIMNAINNALKQVNAEVVSQPITPEKILKALGKIQ